MVITDTALLIKVLSAMEDLPRVHKSLAYSFILLDKIIQHPTMKGISEGKITYALDKLVELKLLEKTIRRDEDDDDDEGIPAYILASKLTTEFKKARRLKSLDLVHSLAEQFVLNALNLVGAANQHANTATVGSKRPHSETTNSADLLKALPAIPPPTTPSKQPATKQVTNAIPKTSTPKTSNSKKTVSKAKSSIESPGTDEPLKKKSKKEEKVELMQQQLAEATTENAHLKSEIETLRRKLAASTESSDNSSMLAESCVIT
jgi:hypothetical protein